MDLGVTGPVYLMSMTLTMILSLTVLTEQVTEFGMSLSPGSDLTTSVTLPDTSSDPPLRSPGVGWPPLGLSAALP